jgi:hypothetical protein
MSGALLKIHLIELELVEVVQEEMLELLLQNVPH